MRPWRWLMRLCQIEYSIWTFIKCYLLLTDYKHRFIIQLSISSDLGQTWLILDELSWASVVRCMQSYKTTLVIFIEFFTYLWPLLAKIRWTCFAVWGLLHLAIGQESKKHMELWGAFWSLELGQVCSHFLFILWLQGSLDMRGRETDLTSWWKLLKTPIEKEDGSNEDISRSHFYILPWSLIESGLVSSGPGKGRVGWLGWGDW